MAVPPLRGPAAIPLALPRSVGLDAPQKGRQGDGDSKKNKDNSFTSSQDPSAWSDAAAQPRSGTGWFPDVA
jgi:hypothetical protein